MSNPRSQDERAFGELLRQERRKTDQPEFSRAFASQDICYAVRQSQADHEFRFR